MCLGVPGKVLEIEPNSLGMTMGKVSFGGIAKEVCLAYVPEAQVGDYVIVHAGFAISRLDEAEAMEVFDLLSQMEELAATESHSVKSRAVDGVVRIEELRPE
jgi:hydrogenase expression/formation protein HypC